MRTRQERLRSRNTHLRLGNELTLARGRADEVRRHRPGAARHSYRARSSCPAGPPVLFDHRLGNRALDILLRQRSPERRKLQLVEPLEKTSLAPWLNADRFSARRVEGNLIARLETPRLAMLSGQGDLALAGDRRENLVGHRDALQTEAPYFSAW